MHKERFYLNIQNLNTPTVEIQDQEHRHLAHVMRMRIGEEVDLINGLGSIACAEIIKIEKEKTILKIRSFQNSPKTTLCIQLGIPLMRPSKLEWIIEKGVELGADSFFLYPAEHSKQENLSEHQLQRLDHIIISAIKQSKRLYLPSIEIVDSLQRLCLKAKRIFFGDVRSSAQTTFEPLEFPLLFITGPESGFSKEEISFLSEKATGVHINPNILRAETAPIAALSILSWEMGKLK